MKVGMARTWRTRLIGLGIVTVCAVGAVWWINRDRGVPDKPPAGAPHAGTCWTVSPQTAKRALPWPGRPVDCAGPHTVEVYHVGQVPRDLVQRARSASGDDRTVAVNLMYAQARRTCGTVGGQFLGGDWHGARVALLANWIEPSRDGFFGCAVAQSTGPGGDGYVTRTGSLRGQAHALAVSCVNREADTIRFASCDSAHTGEFVGTYIVTPGDAPFEAGAVTAAVTKGCGQATLSYLGLPADATRTDLHIGYVGPTTQATWLGSDQTFACYASADAPMRGTIRALGAGALPR
jgi:Septum formation